MRRQHPAFPNTQSAARSQLLTQCRVRLDLAKTEKRTTQGSLWLHGLIAFRRVKSEADLVAASFLCRISSVWGRSRPARKISLQMLLKAADIGSKAMIISALAVQIGKGTPMRKIDRWKLSTLLLVCALLLTILYSRSPSISLGGGRTRAPVVRWIRFTTGSLWRIGKTAPLPQGEEERQRRRVRRG